MIQLASTNPVHTMSAGPFGRAVIQHLKLLSSDITHTEVSDTFLPFPWPAARINALISWRQSTGLCELLNQISHTEQVPFVPLIQDLTTIRVGPIVVPGKGPCWNCWMTRSRQHSGWTPERMALSRHYCSHPEDGPNGYLDSFASMAAIRLKEAIDSIDSQTVVPGSVWQIDMLTGHVTTSALVGVHDCLWCGLHKSKTTRTVSDLRKELSYLWTHTMEGLTESPAHEKLDR